MSTPYTVSDDLSPFDVDGYKYIPQRLALMPSYYYEWDGTSWTKMNAEDPEPFNLPTGSYDGQIIEVPKTK